MNLRIDGINFSYKGNSNEIDLVIVSFGMLKPNDSGLFLSGNVRLTEEEYAANKDDLTTLIESKISNYVQYS